MIKHKTLADYISHGRHEMVAFVRDPLSIEDIDLGNKLGETHFGILVCERKNPQDMTKAQFFYKSKPLYKQDSDIAFGDFNLDSAIVTNEVPLAISTSFSSHYHLMAETETYKEAKALLEAHGLY